MIEDKEITPYESYAGVIILIYRLTPRSDYWHYRMRLGGKQVTARGGKSRDEAYRAAVELIRSHRKKRGPYYD